MKAFQTLKIYCSKNVTPSVKQHVSVKILSAVNNSNLLIHLGLNKKEIYYLKKSRSQGFSRMAWALLP